MTSIACGDGNHVQDGAACLQRLHAHSSFYAVKSSPNLDSRAITTDPTVRGSDSGGEGKRPDKGDGTENIPSSSPEEETVAKQPQSTVQRAALHGTGSGKEIDSSVVMFKSAYNFVRECLWKEEVCIERVGFSFSSVEIVTSSDTCCRDPPRYKIYRTVILVTTSTAYS